MLARPNRLRKSQDITRVYKRGRYGASEGILSIKALRTTAAESRAVVVVGKKVSKRAVVRNTNRRRLAAQLAELWGTATPGYDIVVSVHSDTSKLTAEQLKRHLSEALRRAEATSLELK